jgi:hypothetical protein
MPCTEQGIRNAVAAGGGPYKFECDGPTTVVTAAEIVIDNDVVLDGEGNLTIDGDAGDLVPLLLQQPVTGLLHRVFTVQEGVTAELIGLSLTGGWSGYRGLGGAILNWGGSLTLTNCTVFGNHAGLGGGIANYGIVGGDAGFAELTVTNSTVSNNTGYNAAGILNYGGTLSLTNSTVSENHAGNLGGGIWNSGPPGTLALTLTNSTVSGNSAFSGGGIESWYTELAVNNSTVSGNSASTGGGGIRNRAGTLMLTNSTISANSADSGSGIFNEGWSTEEGFSNLASSLIDGDCDGAGIVTSLGYNIESPGDTCGFDQPTDQVRVSADDLKLIELADNGGPTQTHGLDLGSVAIDQIPADECVDAEGAPLTTDQRGFTRPVAILGAEPKCDVGAFEVQP